MRVRASWAQLDRHFPHVIAALEGDEQNFGVEAPALDGLELEDGLRGVRG